MPESAGTADDGAAGEEATIRQDVSPYGYQLAAMLWFLIFADNLLGRIEGPGETMWLWLRSARWELIFVSGVLSLVCQLMFWSGIVRTGNRRIPGAQRPARGRNSVNVEPPCWA